jgi:anti-sigma factor RsiW
VTCDEARVLLHPYLDGELDLMRSLEVEQHLSDCGACARSAANVRVLRSGIADAGLYYSAPARLEGRVREIGQQTRRGARLSRPRLLASAGLAAAAILLVGLLLGSLLRVRSGNDLIAREAVADHVRSLMAGHLTDVLSSNQHTVKPWFEGKLDFSPAVVDLAAQGFPLVGGRLDYLDGHPVAAIVYRHGGHPINLFVWPSPDARPRPPKMENRNCYNLVHWSERESEYWAVSSANPGALNQFVSDVRKAQGSAQAEH